MRENARTRERDDSEEIAAEVGSGYIFLLFGLTWVVGGLFWVLLDPAAVDLLDLAESHSSTSQSATGIGYMRDLWTIMPFVAAALGMVQLLVGAALVRARGGGLV